MNTLLQDIRRLWRSLVRWWLESRGRKRSALRYPFPENEVVSPAFLMNVSPLLRAYYLNLHPSQYAVAVAPDGHFMNVNGGYSEVPPGRYLLHYIDRQNRVCVIPPVSETTLDGAQVTLELVITYRVIDPIRAMETQQPADTFFVFIQSDLKEFIRTHRYDDLVGDNAGQAVDHGLVSRYMRDQHLGREEMARLFRIAEVVVEGRTGDPKLTEIREKFQVQRRQNIAETELQKQNQELQEKAASLEAEIKRIRARSQATEQEILQKMESQRIELEKERAEQQLQQQRVMRALDAIGQAVSNPAYQYDPRGMDLIKQMLGEIGTTTHNHRGGDTKQEAAQPQPASAANPNKLDMLTNLLMNWSDRK